MVAVIDGGLSAVIDGKGVGDGVAHFRLPPLLDSWQETGKSSLRQRPCHSRKDSRSYHERDPFRLPGIFKILLHEAQQTSLIKRIPPDIENG